MISFEQACDLVEAAHAPTWPPEHGTYYVDRTEGREDAEGWLIRHGAREYLVDGDEAFLLIPGAPACVDKRTGRVESLVYLPGTPDGDRIEAMTPFEPG